MSEVLKFQCAATGARLDAFLAARLAGLSRMRIAHLIRAGACTINGARGAAGQRVAAGDVVELELDSDAPSAMTPEPLPLRIVYEDAELLVVDKPAGLLMHPTRGVKTGTLANALAYHLNRSRIVDCGLRNAEGTGRSSNTVEPPLACREQQSTDQQSELPSSQSAFRIPHSAIVRPGLAHRLDRATSGLLVVAKTQRALGILARHFHERLVAKHYLALVRGRVAEDECEIDAPIGRRDDTRPHWRVLSTGKPARTRLRVVERGADTTLVELEPLTGRTNQLRIHCAHAGHAIVGDEWYDVGTEAAVGPVSARLCLHAARLAFHHPTGGRWLLFVSPLPAEIAAQFAAADSQHSFSIDSPADSA